MHWLYRIAVIGVIMAAFAGSAAAQTPTEILTPADQTHIAAARTLIAAYGDAAWSGFGDPVPLLLIRTAEHEVLAGATEPPDGFTAIPDLTVSGAPVFLADQFLTPQPIASAWPVGESWAAAIPARDLLQAILDAQLGPEVVTLDDATYVRVLVHEMFHAFQLNTLGGPQHIPTRLSGTTSMDWVAQLDLDALNAAHANEGQALRAALEAETDDQARAAVGEFLALRANRRAALDAAGRDDLIAYERSVEWIEGPANAVSLALVLRAPDLDDPALSAAITFHDPQEEWGEFLDQVADPGAIEGSIRERYTAMGAAQVFVLNRLMPGWQSRALQDGIALEDMLAEAITASD